MFERISFGLYVYVIFFNYQKGVAPVIEVPSIKMDLIIPLRF